MVDSKSNGLITQQSKDMHCTNLMQQRWFNTKSMKPISKSIAAIEYTISLSVNDIQKNTDT